MVKFTLTLKEIERGNGQPTIQSLTMEWIEDIPIEKGRQMGVAFVNNPRFWREKCKGQDIISVGESGLDVEELPEPEDTSIF